MSTAIHRAVIAAGLLTCLAAAAPAPGLAQPAPTAADGLTVTRWAAEPMIASPVAVGFDNLGRAYVTQTGRRKTSDLDIRLHREWMVEDLAMRSIEDYAAFVRKKMDPSLSPFNLWQPDLNGDGLHDWRDLTVETERVSILSDTDDDGAADKAVLFADGFNTEVTGVAAGVLWRDGEVFVTVAPDLWKLRDTDGDGKADERKSLAHGFGHHVGIGGHDMHGLALGPDGKIYWSIGDLGVNAVGLDGKRHAHPHQGAVMRCNPDGSEFEVYAHGLRNPQELAFNEYGDLFSVDNDSDFAGDKERIVHIVEGSDSGWRQFWQYFETGTRPWMTEGYNRTQFEGQAAFILPPVAWYDDGPCGFKFNPGTALGEKWRNHFFITLFTGSSAKGQMKAFTLKPAGASYALDQDKVALSGVLPTGIDFGPDGALYVLDWVKGWDVHDEGRVWRMDVTGGAHPLRGETANLLREGMSGREIAELSQLLGHADMRVRLAAQFELAGRGKEGQVALGIAAKQSKELLARLHGIWGIGQQARRQPQAIEPVLPLLRDAEPEVRAQTAKIIGDAAFTAASAELAKLLSDPQPRVRYFAAAALRRAGEPSAMPAVLKMLEANDDTDAYLRHAGALALTGTADSRALAQLVSHRSRAVRLAAVVAMRHRRDPAIAAFLDDHDQLVVLEAARAIHDDDGLPGADARPALAKLIVRSGLDNEALLRRVVNANLHLGGAEQARALAAFAVDASRPEYPRVEALWSLSVWDAPPAVDRVEGKYVGFGPRKAGIAGPALEPHIAKLLADPSPKVQAAAAEAAAALKLDSAGPRLAELAIDAREDPEARLAALKALGELKHPRTAVAAAAALKDQDEHVRQEAQRLIVAADPTSDTALAVLETSLKSGSTSDKQAALLTLGTIETDIAAALLAAQLDRLFAGKLHAALELDLLEAAATAAGNSPLVREKLHAFEASRSASDPLAQFREVLEGGNAEAGRAIAFEHIAAQCIRCHTIKGQGGSVGPDLSGIGKRVDRRYLVESMVNPNAAIAPGYGMVMLTLKNGQSVAATLKEETPAGLTVIMPDGKTRQIPLSDIATRTPAISGMPPMHGILTKRQMRDVIEYLVKVK